MRFHIAPSTTFAGFEEADHLLQVMKEALKVLGCVTKRFGINFSYTHAPIGGAGYDTHGEHFPKSTLEVCEAADAILFGSIGGPVEEQAPSPALASHISCLPSDPSPSKSCNTVTLWRGNLLPALAT